MLAYLFLGILGLMVVLGMMTLFARAKPANVARGLRWSAVAFAGAGIVLLPFIGRGSLAFLGPAVLIPLLMRMGMFRRGSDARAAPSSGQTSSVETAWLTVSLDHDSGGMDGTVKDGRFAGRTLSELALPDLLSLLEDCRAADPESVPLLEAYLDRSHPAWREQEEPAGTHAHGSGPAASPPGGMSREEALQILGLEAGATPEAIREAHRRLMQKLHPDRGGSTYLAAKLNQAKDLLLRN